MKAILGAIALVICTVGQVWAQPQPPGHPAFSITPTQSDITLTITWVPSTAPDAIHVVSGGYNDGLENFAVQATSPYSRKVAYHPSGSSFWYWACVVATLNGQQSGVSCNAVMLPSKPQTSGKTVQFSVLEPTTKSSGAPLNDLQSVRIYYRVDTGTELSVTYPASSLSGGKSLSNTISVPSTAGTVTLVATALNTSGAESVRSNIATKVFGGIPLPLTGGVLGFDR